MGEARRGYDESWDTWEPAANLSCPVLLERFEASRKKKIPKKTTSKATAKARPRPAPKAGTKKKMVKAKTSKVKAKTSKASRPVKRPAPKKSAKKFSKTTVASDPTEVDEEAGLDGVSVLVGAESAWACRLSFIDLSVNSDKYYYIQVLTDGDKVWLYQRWGRSGTTGQKVATEMAEAEATDGFQKKFKEKTGNAWGSANVAQDGKYKLIQSVSRGRPAGVWEYYQDNYLDGKGPGWYPYHASAVPIVEGVHSEWQANPGNGLNVRCVQSGHFSYRVDFDSMSQTNLSTQKVRPIRRNGD